MIVREVTRVGDKRFINTYSDKYLMIEREGNQYSSAMDLEGLNREYTETNQRIFPREAIEQLPIELREKVQRAYSELEEAAK